MELIPGVRESLFQRLARRNVPVVLRVLITLYPRMNRYGLKRVYSIRSSRASRKQRRGETPWVTTGIVSMVIGREAYVEILSMQPPDPMQCHFDATQYLREFNKLTRSHPFTERQCSSARQLINMAAHSTRQDRYSYRYSHPSSPSFFVGV